MRLRTLHRRRAYRRAHPKVRVLLRIVGAGDLPAVVLAAARAELQAIVRDLRRGQGSR